MRRWIVRPLVWLLLLLVFLLAVAALIVGTTPGSRWLINRVAPTVGVQIGSVEGTLLHALTLTDVRYALGEQRYRAERLHVAWRASALWLGVVSVADLEVESLAIVIPAGEKEAPPEGEPTWPALGAPLPVRVDRLVIEGFDLTLGDARYQFDRVRTRLDYGMTRARLTDLRLVTAASEAALSATLALRYPYALEAELRWVLAPPQEAHSPHDVTRLVPGVLLSPEFAGQLQIEGDITQLDFSGALRAPEQLALDLAWTTGLGKAAEAPRVDGELEVSGLSLSSYVAAGELAAGEVNARAQVEGWLEDYRIDLEGDLNLPDYPTLNLRTEAQGDMQGLRLEPLALTMEDAEAQLTGTLGWTEGVEWQAELTASGLDPALILSEWPGNLQLQAQSQGRWAGGELTMDTRLEQLQGQLRTLAVEARAQLNASGQRWQLADAYLAVGGNRVQLSGDYVGASGSEASPGWALNWDLAAPLLESIDPELHGSLQSTGSAQGGEKPVQLSFQANAEALALGDWRVGSLSVDVREQSLAQGDASLTAREVELPGLTLQSVQASLSGGPRDHQLEAELALDDFQRLSLGVAGEWTGGGWQGEVNTLTIRSAYTRAMSLAEPFALEASPQAVHLERACLQDRRDDNSDIQTHVCATLDWRAEGETLGELEVERLPLALAQNWLEPGVSFDGYLTGSGQWRQAPGEPAQMDLNLTAENGVLHHQYDGEETDSYPLRNFTLQAELRDKDLQASAAMAVGDYGEMRAELTADLAQRQLNAEADINWRDLSPLEALVPEVHNIKGEVNARLTASGPLDSPQLSASADLREGSFYLPVLATRFTGVGASLQGDHQLLNLTLDVTAGEGSLALEAELRDLFERWQLQARLTGEAARIVDTPILKMRVTPDLTLTGNPEEWRLTGSARVPFARAEIKTLPASATRVSEDVIVVDAEGQGRNQSGPQFYSNIELILGDDVTFNAAGLEARLGGRLRLNREPNRPLQALGEIDIVRGRFESYGQDLTVEEGVLAFTGPADNPGLNITATRTTEDYVAGINIGGTLQNPTSEVFARPAVSESDAMAILFTGKPLSETSSSDQSMLVSAIAKYGLNRGGSFIAGFSDDIGLDEITIKTGDNVNDSQLWLGKYITPKLYIHYAIGLFEDASSMGFTYILNDHFRVEAESGEQQSADVLFEMER